MISNLREVLIFTTEVMVKVKDHFGDVLISFRIEFQTEYDKEEVLLFIIVDYDLDTDEAHRLLDQFDDTYWLKNCNRYPVSLHMDYS